MRRTRFRRNIGGWVGRMVRRRGWWIVVLGLVGAVAVYRSVPREQGERHAAFLDVLKFPPAGEKLVTVNYVGVPLRMIMEDLSKQSGVRMEVDYDGLRSQGITADHVFSVGSADQGPVTLRRALELLSRSRMENGDLLLVGDFASDPAFISTQENVNSPRRFKTVVYSVKDLLQLDSPWVYREEPDARMKTLVYLLETMVEPSLWRESGGSAAMMTRDEELVVNATPRMQYEVGQVLEALRAAGRER